MSNTSFLLNNNEIIDLYQIKLSDFEGSLSFHGSKNFDKDLVFKGVTYIYLPCEMSNLQSSSDGKQNRPTFAISNTNNYVSTLMSTKRNFLGKQLFRFKLLAKDLDAVNFENADKNKNPLGNAGFRDFISSDKFIINKQNYSNKEKVEFELSNVLDLDGLTCPTRKVYNNSCPWQYRGHGCNYGNIKSMDGPYFKDQETKSLTLDEIMEAYDGQSDSFREYLSFWCESDNIVQSEESMDISTNYLGDYFRPKRKKKSVFVQKNFRDNVYKGWENIASTVNATPSVSFAGNLVSTKDYDMPILSFDYYANSKPGIMPVTGNRGTKDGPQYKAQRGTAIPLHISQLVNGQIDRDAYHSYAGKDVTIFYVVRPASFITPHMIKWPWRPSSSPNDLYGKIINFRKGGYINKGLTNNSGSFSLGFDSDLRLLKESPQNRWSEKALFYRTEPVKDTLKLASAGVTLGDNYLPDTETLYNSAFGASIAPADASNSDESFMDEVMFYACSIPSAKAEEGDPAKYSKLYRDGHLLSSVEANFASNSFLSSICFNSNEFNLSHMVIYEVIIFEKILTDKQVEEIGYYLGNKYGIKVKRSSSQYISAKTVSSASFFEGFEDGNLGVPIADENDKLFWTVAQKGEDFKFYDTYGFESMVYKGDYKKDYTYKKGDFVKVDNEINFDFTKKQVTKSFEIPSRFFICAENDVTNVNPLSNTQKWIEDKCSKKLSGCLARFLRSAGNTTESNVNSVKIPFGGFPGTVDYDYKLPTEN